MKVTEVIVELYTEAPTQEVVIEVPDILKKTLLYSIHEIKYERNDNRVVLVAGNVLDTDED